LRNEGVFKTKIKLFLKQKYFNLQTLCLQQILTIRKMFINKFESDSFVITFEKKPKETFFVIFYIVSKRSVNIYF